MDKELDKRITETVCQAWNKLDSSLFGPILSEKFEYISFWVFEAMKGRDRYMDYIKGKFEAIRNGNNPVSAEVIYQEAIDKYVVVLNQGGNLAALEPTIQDNMLISLWMRPVEMTLPAVFTIQKPMHVEKIEEKKERKHDENYNPLEDKEWAEKNFGSTYQELEKCGKPKLLTEETDTCPFCGYKLRPVLWCKITPDILQQKKEGKIFIGEDLYGKPDDVKPDFACGNCGESFILEK